jgi:S-adenosylmethionine decarboxylase proenzyme
MRIGRETKANVYGVSFNKLDNIRGLEIMMRVAITKANMHIVGSPISHKFSPQGVTIVCVLKESHLALHTWPEEGCATIDCYTCGDEGDPGKAVSFILDCLKPASFDLWSEDRGSLERARIVANHLKIATMNGF